MTVHEGGALAGVRVVEVGSFIAGPFCGQLLADHGADVIKIEPPGEGDSMRKWGVSLHKGQSLWWPILARNKHSLSLDLRKPSGVRILRRLLETADVLVENFRPGTLEKWGVPPQMLHEANPRLIVARISGFGQTGPYAGRTGFGAIAEAMAGMRNLNGFPDRPPPRAGLSIGDSLAGLFATIGVLLALRARDTTGRGQVIDVGITDAVLAVMESVLAEHSVTGATRTRAGTGLHGISPSNLYPTADGEWILIAGNADSIFRRLAAAMGRADLCDDARFRSHRDRGANQAVLDALVADWTKTRSLADLLALLEQHGVPAGAVATESAVIADPHFRERRSVVTVMSDVHGNITMQGVVPCLKETPGAVRWLGPALGEHTDAILATELGLDADAISELRQEGII